MVLSGKPVFLYFAIRESSFALRPQYHSSFLYSIERWIYSFEPLIMIICIRQII